MLTIAQIILVVFDLICIVIGSAVLGNWLFRIGWWLWAAAVVLVSVSLLIAHGRF